MTLLQLFLIHRYRTISVHYVSPNDANLKQSESMKNMGIYEEVHTEIGDIIVASVNTRYINELLNSDGSELKKLIPKSPSLNPYFARRLHPGWSNSGRA